MQAPKNLQLGSATGVAVPALTEDLSQSPDYRLMKAVVDIPTIKSTTLTPKVLDPGETVWRTLTKDAQGLSTFPLDASTGAMRRVFDNLVAGSRFAIDSSASQASTAAALTSNMTAALADITLTAVTAGTSGHAISVTYVDPGGVTSALAVDVLGFDITVTLARAASAITSTAAQVVQAINASGAVAVLVTATAEGAGSGVVNALAKANLAGAWDDPIVPVFFGV